MLRRLKPLALRARNLLYRIAYRGTGRWCPLCEHHMRRFRPFGVDERRDEAMCVHCGSLERHRLVWLFLERRTDLFTFPPKRLLHIAPEPCERRIKERAGDGYVSADLSDPDVDVRFDLTNIPYPDASFDVVYCSHVLEHVPDDRRALREFRRILAPGGYAVLLVPITAANTVEDPTITDPRERLRAFGQKDHVRRYGWRDFVKRLKEAGFAVRVVRARDVATRAEITAMGLQGAGAIFLASRASEGSIINDQ
jgi:predicted SAM-dependent methyltransferase